jgi:phosphatidylglycerophosphate synthase
MDLHRIEGAPEWAAVPLAKRTAWQRVAAATRGIVTIGNCFSLLGLLSVPLGLWVAVTDRPAIGALVLMLGRGCDLLDGWLADLTHTKSPLGETIDASFDKVSVVATVVGLVATGLVPLAYALLLLAPQLVMAVLAFVVYVRGSRLHPSRAGKLSMALLWFALLAPLFLGVDSPETERLLKIAAAGLFFVAVATAIVALVGYVREFRKVY